MTQTSPLDLLLMHYAAGNLSPPEQLIVAAHLMLNPAARRKVSQYEAAGAQIMCEAEPTAVRAECLTAVMTRIETAPRAPERPARCGPAPDLNIPAAIYTLISAFCGAQAAQSAQRDCWSQVARGFRAMDLRPCPVRHPGLPRRMPATFAPWGSAGVKQLRLLKLEPGQAAPRHSHHGTEITLLLHGGFRDETGAYNKGDIVIIADPRLVHQPVAGGDGCVSLTLTEAPVRFADPFQQFLNLFRGF